MHDLKLLPLRAAIIQTVRQFFFSRAYLEVDTPILLPANAPEAHIEAIAVAELFLQTSPELCMKRLLAAGCSRIFQVCKCFRKHERGARHLPEFTMLEWYAVGIDYHALMKECEELLNYLADALPRNTGIQVRGPVASLARPWEKLTVAEAFARYAPVSLQDSLAAGTFDEIMAGRIEARLGIERPTFLYDYPAELGALARLQKDNPAVAERFELYVDGVELANGFSELTDSMEQRTRFEAEREKIRALGRDPGPLPEKFLDELSRLDRAAGIALGLDRLVMIFAGVDAIDEAVSFTPEEL